MRLHPLLIYPEPEFEEIARGATETCIKEGAWSGREIAQFRVQQGLKLARFEADVPGARARFKQALKWDASLELKVLETKAKDLAQFARVEQEGEPAR